MSRLIHVSPPQYREADDVHLRACVDAQDNGGDGNDGDGRGDLALADVLFFARPTPAALVAAQLDVYPGCLVCAGVTEGGTLILAVRCGRTDGPTDGRAPTVASALHAMLVRQLAAQAQCADGQ